MASRFVVLITLHPLFTLALSSPTDGACLGQGVATLGLAFSGCNTTVAIICLVLTTSVGGVDTSGQIASMVDLSPNFAKSSGSQREFMSVFRFPTNAGYIMSLANGITAFTGIIAPMLVGVITYQNQTSSAWQLVYLVSAIMVTVPLVFHLIFGTSEMQEWNYPTKSVTELDELEEEKQKLNTNAEGNEKVSKEYMSNMTQ
uniref:Uncharacterized protein n=1 Tax=Timema poppense TaxID=170557 RepID=A0A7R9CNN3_TIMPO|nr:unnamed protein product [Timema poppensis]